jgi:hypothetical protein
VGFLALAVISACHRETAPPRSHDREAVATDAAPLLDSAIDTGQVCASDGGEIRATLVVGYDDSAPASSPATFANYVPVVRLRVSRGTHVEEERRLFGLPDIEPIDACHAEAERTVATFSCDRGEHPSARLAVGATGIELTVSRPGSPKTTELLSPDACGAVSVLSLQADDTGSALDGGLQRYAQWTPTDARDANAGGSHFDPFEGIAAAHRKLVQGRSPERCRDAGPGPTVTIVLAVPHHPASETGVTISAPQLGLREPLWIGGPGESCDAREYPRSAIAAVRCYDSREFTVHQVTIFAEHDDLQWGFRKTGPPVVLLPCNARIEFVVRS